MSKSVFVSCLGAAAMCFAAPSVEANSNTAPLPETTIKKTLRITGPGILGKKDFYRACLKEAMLPQEQLADIDNHIAFIKQWMDENGVRNAEQLSRYMGLEPDPGQKKAVGEAFAFIAKADQDYKAGTDQGIAYLKHASPSQIVDTLFSYAVVIVALARVSRSETQLANQIDSRIVKTVNALADIGFFAQDKIKATANACNSNIFNRPL